MFDERTSDNGNKINGLIYFFAIPELECGKVVHEDALPKQTRAKAKDEEPDPDTVTLSGIQLTL